MCKESLKKAAFDHDGVKDLPAQISASFGFYTKTEIKVVHDAIAA